MPLLIAGLIRSAIQFAVTIGIIEIASRFILPLVNKAISEVIQIFGVPEQEAIDIVANSWLEAAEQIGIGALAIKSKTPVKIAERLGFTSKGFGKRPIKPATQTKINSSTGIAVVAARQIPKLTVVEATEIINSAQTRISGFKIAYDFLFKFLGVTFLGGMVIANWIDFGNWNNGAYQKTLQRVIKFLTFGLLIPDPDYRKSKTTSPEVFDKVYNAYKLEGAVGISDPFKQATVPFTRDNLLDLTDQVGAAMLISQGSASTKDVLLTTAAMIIFDLATASTTKSSATSPIVVGTLPTRQKTSFSANADELTNIALGKVSKFLDELPSRLDFELMTRSNPINESGSFLAGKYYTVQIKLRSGQFGSTKLGEFVLRPLAEGEKTLTPDQENPFETALRAAASGSIPVQSLAISAPSITPPSPQPSTPAAAVINRKPYIRFLGSPDVFSQETGKYISASEAARLGINDALDVEVFSRPRPNVKTGTDFALWSGKDLTPEEGDFVGAATRIPVTIPTPTPTQPLTLAQAKEQARQEMLGKDGNAQGAIGERWAREMNDWLASTRGNLTFVPLPIIHQARQGLPDGYGGSDGTLFSSFANYRSITGRNQ